MKGKSLEQKDVQNENKMRGNVWKFLWTPKSGQIKMPAARPVSYTHLTLPTNSLV